MNHIITLQVQDELLKAYFFYSSILVIKMTLMATMVGYKRFKYMVFDNPEDVQDFNNVQPSKNEVVERVKRAHMNDVENIPLFLVASLMYILTNPSVWTAILLFRIFTLARIVHTIVFAVYVIKQPARLISYVFGYCCTMYMCIQILLKFA